MEKAAKYILFSVLIVLFLSGCSLMNNGNKDAGKDVLQYKDSFIGDNSAVVNIIGQLHHSEEFQEVALDTKAAPYGMTIKYGYIDAAMIEKEYKETAIYNATFLFALIKNAEWITFQFEDAAYRIMKSTLSDWYDRELDEFTDENELEAYVLEQLKDENRVEEFDAANIVYEPR